MAQNITLSFLGCGNMGLAILNGLLASPPAPTTTSSSKDSLFPTTFVLSVRSAASATALTRQFSSEQHRITVLQGGNVRAAKSATAVLLGCKPHMVAALLAEPGLKDALQGKLLISVVSGWTRVQLETALYGSATTVENASERCWIARAMPNVACAVAQSATGVEVSDPVLPTRYSGLVDAIFRAVGTVTHLAPQQMDVVTAFGSTPAFFAIMVESLVDAAVAMGMPRPEARVLAVQCLRGTAELLHAGESPTGLKEKVTSPGGATIGAIMGLEEAGVRGIVGRALRESASIATVLGSGYRNVNGTRGMSKL